MKPDQELISPPMKQLLEITAKNRASDLHLLAGVSPMIRVNGELFPITGKNPLSEEEIEKLIFTFLGEEGKARLIKERELDTSHSLADGSRFRINFYFQKGTVSASFRYLVAKIPSVQELNLPEILLQTTRWRQGFVLIAGPTGHGKSTAVASLIEEINNQRKAHIITIEDPIEYVFSPKKSIISQREVGADTLSWHRALRSCLREDPNVVFVGEMRDLESISQALTIAETGHLVFSTLHTNSAFQTIDRIIDVFPEGSKQQVRSQLANVLGAVISLRLVPTIDEARVPAVEILFSNSAVKTAIREGKTHMINNVIQTSLEAGMISLERSLAAWVKKGKIDLEMARSYALDPKELNRQLRQ